MAVTPEMILNSASAMCDGDGDGREVDWRNATSRAYYAAYHGCRALAQSIEPNADLSRSTSHQNVRAILLQSGSPTEARAVAHQLNACRQVRNRADYQIGEDFERSECGTVVETCRIILKRVDAIAERMHG